MTTNGKPNSSKGRIIFLIQFIFFYFLSHYKQEAKEFLRLTREKQKLVEFDAKLTNRSLNEGFSGGEKKKNEIVQMAVMSPRLCFLDETDSGLDIVQMAVQPDLVPARNQRGQDFGMQLGHHRGHIETAPHPHPVQHVQKPPDPLARPEAALFKLPERGGVLVQLRGERLAGVNGVIANVVSLLTGATEDTGFKGIGGRFDRRQRLFFGADIPGEIRFTRLDTAAFVDLSACLERVPADARLAPLMARSLAGTATDEEVGLFQSLWQERVRALLLRHADDPGVFVLH